MPRLCATFALLLLFFFSTPKVRACGFNFVGDCSTTISLKINGTQDSFAVADCPDVLKFDGFVLGNLQSLFIARAKATTWESCQNNVSGMELWYRVYQQGYPGGAWQSIGLQEDFNTLVGPYTTRYRSINTNTNLTNGLTVGKTYVLEIYFKAEVDTIGDDFIPETTLLQNNNGQNYHFTFQYGGVSAPPFVVTTTKVIPVRCHGDSTGVAGVSVYGNQSGLFYEWSTGGNNFWILAEIPAGTYVVTVTGTGGYSASDTISITEPPLLEAQFTVSGLGCNGAPGQAAVSLSGGTAPYYYVWDNGLQDSVVHFPNSGDHALTVTDSKGCGAVFWVNLPAQPLVVQSIAAEICQGATYSAGGMAFTAQGNYEISLPGTNGDCDTLLQLALTVLEPPVVTLQIITVQPFACSESDQIHLVIETTTNAEEPVFEWIYDGQVISTADTCNFVFSGTGLLPVVTVTDKHGCTAQAGGFGVTIPPLPPLSVSANVANPVAGFDNGAITIEPFGGLAPYTVLWSNGATTLAINNLGPGAYCATVTDSIGCIATICETLESSGIAEAAAENLVKISPNPVIAGQQVKITLPQKFMDREVRLEILDLWGQTLLRQTTQIFQGVLQVKIPENACAGTLFVRIESLNTGRVTGRITVF